MQIHTMVQNGSVVGWTGASGPLAATNLMATARRLAHSGHPDCARLRPKHFAALNGMRPNQLTQGRQHAEVGGWLKRGLKKVGKGIKKAAFKTVQVAHKITHNKVFEAVHHAIQKAIPAPFKVFAQIGAKSNDLIHKFMGPVLKGKGSKQGKLLPAIAKAAKGELSLDKLAELSKSVGVPVDQTKAMAAVARLKELAPNSAEAAGTLKVLRALDTAKRSGNAKPAQAIVAEAQMHKLYPGAHSFTIKRGGKSYRALVMQA